MSTLLFFWPFFFLILNGSTLQPLYLSTLLPYYNFSLLPLYFANLPPLIPFTLLPCHPFTLPFFSSTDLLINPVALPFYSPIDASSLIPLFFGPVPFYCSVFSPFDRFTLLSLYCAH